MKKIKIGFFAPPVSGHLFPMLYLAKELDRIYRDTYEIVFFTGKSKQELIESYGFQTRIIHEKDPYLFDRIANLQGRFVMGKQFMHISKHLTPLVEEILHMIDGECLDVAVVDFVTYPAALALRQRSIPWITHMATSFVIETGDGVPPFFGGLMYKDTKIYRLRDTMLFALTRTVKRIMIRLRYRYLHTYLKSLYDADGMEIVYSPYSIVSLGTKELEFPKTWPSYYTFIGHGSLSEQKEVEFHEQFSTAEKRVLVTTGTMSAIKANQMYDLIQKVAPYFPKYFFVFTDGDASNNQIRVNGNIQRCAFVPYETYIPQFDIVIHHGGAGILHTCMRYKKPAIVLPNMYDQFDYASRLEYHGLAIRVRHRLVKNIRTALYELETRVNEAQLTLFQETLASYHSGNLLHNEIQRVYEEFGQ